MVSNLTKPSLRTEEQRTGVVDTILLTTGDTDFHLEPKFDLSHALEVLLAGLDVLLLGFFGEIEHVGTIQIENVSFNRVGNERPATENSREKRLSFLLVVSLVSVEHTYKSAFWSVHRYVTPMKALLTVEPGKELLSAVVGVEDDMFYDICVSPCFRPLSSAWLRSTRTRQDELGILVWQDFAFACGAYPAHPTFLESVEKEAIANVRRLRSHPSLAIFAGNNED